MGMEMGGGVYLNGESYREFTGKVQQALGCFGATHKKTGKCHWFAYDSQQSSDWHEVLTVPEGHRAVLQLLYDRQQPGADMYFCYCPEMYAEAAKTLRSVAAKWDDGDSSWKPTAIAISDAWFERAEYEKQRQGFIAGYLAANGEAMLQSPMSDYELEVAYPELAVAWRQVYEGSWASDEALLAKLGVEWAPHADQGTP